MKVEIDGKAILEEILAGTKSDRMKTSLYLSSKVFEDFKKKCGQASASQVIEKLMEAFNASLEQSGGRKR